MSDDAKWIVGTGIALAVLMVSLAGLLSVRISGLSDRLDSLDGRLRTVETGAARLDERVNDLERRMTGEEDRP